MNIVRQSRLSFQEGNSDKVYEVDLVEVGSDRFVVNFRYGRRGSTLREGSKTAVAVGRAEADRVFDKLVGSKTKKGYREAGSAAPAAPSPRVAKAPASPADDSARDRAVIAALRGESEWPIARAIWRAGQLELAEAAPILETMLETMAENATVTATAYAAVWALGRIGAPSSLPVLRSRATNSKNEAVLRIAREAVRLRGSADERRSWMSAAKEMVHQELRPLMGGGALLPALRDRCASDPEKFAPSLSAIYYAGEGTDLAALRTYLAEMPLEQHYVKQARAIFKMAEFRREPQTWGVLVHRFEVTRGPRKTYWSSLPYSDATRRYFQRRAWRTLRTLAEDGRPDFVRMATGALLPFVDSDVEAPAKRETYSWSGSSRTMRWGRWGNRWALSHLLYGNSSRYQVHSASVKFRIAEGADDAQHPAEREESFPSLWDATPVALLHLLDESRCEDVHRFAVKAVKTNTANKANRAFLDGLDVDAIVMLLGAPYSVTCELGFDLAKRAYDPTSPDSALVRAVVLSNFVPARSEAHQWLRAHAAHFASETQLMAELVTSAHQDNRMFVRDFLRLAALGQDAARLIVGRVIASFAEFGEAETERIRDAGDTLLTAFGRELATVGENVIRDLLGHPLLGVQELGAKVLLAHQTFGTTPPDDILLALIDSEHSSIRSLGARLFGQLGDADLLERRELVCHLATHELEDLRNAIRPALARLIDQHPPFARELAVTLAKALLTKNPEGVPAHVVSLMKSELAASLADIDRDLTMSLLRAKSPHAQELGGLLLATNLTIDDLSVRELVALASHSIRSVRAGVWAMCEANVERLKLAMNGAVGLLDAEWDDSREWAFDFFTRAFSDDDLAPAVLVAICDSVRPRVQAFGRKLIGERFREADGGEYLAKLSEHPSADIQLFASNLLEGYAAGNIDRLRELEPYFLRVLSNISKGRISRQRCILFLAQQAQESREAAELTARIFSRQSATIAVTHREPMVVVLAAIRRAHPDIVMPLTIRETEVRDGV